MTGVVQKSCYTKFVSKTIITSPKTQQVDKTIEKTVRPYTLDGYIGQPVIKETVTVIVESAKIKGKPAEHIILYGPPGLGKTTLAHIIANELKVPIRTTSGPALERAGDVVAILTNLKPGSVLFIDEIHRLKKPLEEILYPAMEDGKVDIILGKGPGAKTVELKLPPFTLIGATTRFGFLSGPLRDRFGAQLHLDFYNEDEIHAIIAQTANQLSINIDTESIRVIAKCSRRTPRVANRLLKHAENYALAKTRQNKLNVDLTRKALKLLRIDEMGLGKLDRRYLELLAVEGEQATGISTLAAAMHEEKETLEDVVEPFLIQNGLIKRTPQGRIATQKALKYLSRI